MEFPPKYQLVAGIVSLRASTPNSHVAILSRSFGIPFVYLDDAQERLRVQQLADHEVVLRAGIVANRDAIKVLDVQARMTAEVRTGDSRIEGATAFELPAEDWLRRDQRAGG
jgi:phosphoenolpyruvate-protein kinase (PTS system EI component)